MKKAIKYTGIVLGSLLLIFLLSPFFSKDFYNIDDEWVDSMTAENDSLDNYTIDNNLITNSNIGFSFQVPDEWRIEEDRERDDFNIFSPDHTGRKPILSNGCQVTVSAVNFIKNQPDFIGGRLDSIKSQIEEDRVINENQKIITVNETVMLKTPIHTGSEEERAILLEIPLENTLIHFGFIYALKDESYCLDEIDSLIQSILVD